MLIRISFLLISLAATIGAQSTQPMIQPLGGSVTDFCEVLRSPLSYVGQTILVDAVYAAGPEMAWFEYPPTCEIANAQRSAIRYIWDEYYEKNSDQKIIKKVNKGFSRRDGSWNPKRVSGRFVLKVREFERSNPHDTRYQFDFVVMKVVSVN